jgi:hypothetical protein
MTTQLEELVQRLARAEKDIAEARGEVAVLRRQGRRTRGFATGLAMLAAFALIAAWSSTSTQAQASGPTTVKAPFVVVDSANKPIMLVSADGSRGMNLFRSDGQRFAILSEEGANLRGPLFVTDNANKAIVSVQDDTASQVKDAKGVEKTLTTNRGLHLFNSKGDTVARVASLNGDGYVSARKGGQGTGLGGVQGALYSDSEGAHIILADASGKPAARLSSDRRGLTFENESGTVLTEVNRTHFWMGNAAGAGIIEAGELPDGRGRVTVGPRFGGPQGGGQLNFPYMILGRK